MVAIQSSWQVYDAGWLPDEAALNRSDDSITIWVTDPEYPNKLE